MLGRAELEQALRARARAENLLDTLLADRDRLEARMAEGGRRDPIKTVSGRSAMERAIATTRDLITALDHLAGRRA